MANQSDNTVQLSVNLHREVADALKWMASLHDCTITEAIRQCISTQTYVEKAHLRGAKIIVKEPDEPLREVIFVREQGE